MNSKCEDCRYWMRDMTFNWGQCERQNYPGAKIMVDSPDVPESSMPVNITTHKDFSCNQFEPKVPE